MARSSSSTPLFFVLFLFGIGVTGDCTGTAAKTAAQIGLYGVVVYMVLQVAILAYVYIPTCFLFATKFGLFHSTNEALFQRFSNEFFVITVTAAVVSADRVRCNIQSEAAAISHEALEVSGVAIGGRYKFMVYSTLWWLKYTCLPVIVGFFTDLLFIAYFAIILSVNDSSNCTDQYGTALGLGIAVFVVYVGLAYCLIRIPLVQAILSFIAWVIALFFSCICINPLRRCLLKQRENEDENKTSPLLNQA